MSPLAHPVQAATFNISCDNTSITEFNNAINAANGNNIEDNTPDAVAHGDGDANVNAMGNYWGATDGPSGADTGAGDGVTSNVDFNNFATAPIANLPAPTAVTLAIGSTQSSGLALLTLLTALITVSLTCSGRRRRK